MSTAEQTDWYDHRDELRPGMVFESCWGIVRLDHRVPGDGSQWSCDVWIEGRPDLPGTIYEKGRFSGDEMKIEPGDLTNRLPDNHGDN
jgi:hypothetical protein